jgi:hypothetical protein
MAKFKLLIIVLTVMVIGGGIFLMGLSTLYNEHRLSSHGKSAEVIRVLPELGQNGDLYFEGEDGQELHVGMAVPMEIQTKIDLHQKVSVDYLPNDPSVNRWTGQSRGTGFMTLRGLGLLAFGVFLFRVLGR